MSYLANSLRRFIVGRKAVQDEEEAEQDLFVRQCAKARGEVEVCDRMEQARLVSESQMPPPVDPGEEAAAERQLHDVKRRKRAYAEAQESLPGGDAYLRAKSKAERERVKKQDHLELNQAYIDLITEEREQEAERRAAIQSTYEQQQADENEAMVFNFKSRPLKKSVKKSAGKSVKKSAGKAVKKSAGKAVKKSAGKAVKKSAGKAVKKSVKKSDCPSRRTVRNPHTGRQIVLGGSTHKTMLRKLM